MPLAARVRRALAGAISAVAVTGVLLCSGTSAAADPPPGCTAADLANVAAGVSSATSDYLWAHPDVNAFFTSLKGRNRTDIRDDVRNYLSANPQVKSDLDVIRQPLIDLRTRCQ
jgi:hemophore-related protein